MVTNYGTTYTIRGYYGYSPDHNIHTSIHPSIHPSIHAIYIYINGHYNYSITIV